MEVSVAEMMLPKESAARNLEVMVQEISVPAMIRQATAEAALIVCRERRRNNGTGGARERTIVSWAVFQCVLSYHVSMKSLQVDIAQFIVQGLLDEVRMK